MQSLGAQLKNLEKAALSALEAWDISKPTLSLLKYRENAVYKVIEQTGKHYVLRIHRRDYHSKQAIASELNWIHALRKTQLSIPNIVLSKEGKLFTTVSVANETTARVVDLFAWVEGATLTDLLTDIHKEDVASLFYKVGESAAQLHIHASTWPLPKNFQRHAWDIEGLLGEQPFWGKFWELERLTVKQKTLLLEARAALKAHLETYPQTKQTYGLIHADMIPDNLMFSNGELTLIDFDDAGFGYYLFELATILRPLQTKAFYESAKDALLKGYQTHKPLNKEDLSYLNAFSLARALTYLGWYHDRPELASSEERINKAIEDACLQSEQFLSEQA